MYKKKKKIPVEQEKIKLELNSDLVLKTPVATPFRVPIPGHSNTPTGDTTLNRNSKHLCSLQIKRLFNSEEENKEEINSKMKSSDGIVAISNVLGGVSLSHEEIINKILSSAFRVPIPGYTGTPTMNRFLGMRMSSRRSSLYDPYAEGSLILYCPPELSAHEKMKSNDNESQVHVVVDPLLCKILRPHQREGVKFMYECVTGARIEGFSGCIMADEMGLGKTLQCITLMWTLLRQGPEAKPTINRCIIICPSSLVKNWDKEISKWLHGRLNSLPIDSGKKDEIINSLKQFMAQTGTRIGTPVIIISYEAFRLYADILNEREIGLVICDEGHRLKNSDNQTYRALSGLKCSRRVLISGTPIQNDLLEYYSLINFVNPGLLGPAAEFRRNFESFILRSRDANSTEVQQKMGEEKLQELLSLVNRCIIRRTSALLTQYLPVKYELVCICALTELQTKIYSQMIKYMDKELRRARGALNTYTTLAFITNLKKLCNHPQLIFDKCQAKEAGFEDCLELFPPDFSVPSTGRTNNNRIVFDPVWSGKMKVLDYLLAYSRRTCDDRFVLVSNYTQTMDAFEQLCNLRDYPFVRLDGSMSIKQRSKIVEKFNDPKSDCFVFLLSSKAGGCGLNLIGANRLVMFDPDWNPANDGQAMARIWRDGQKKTCFVYRLLSRGTIEEKIFQRQTHKKALSSCVVDEAENVARHFSSDELKTLFQLEIQTSSDTHDKLKCQRCMRGKEMKDPPVSADTNSDLAAWYHSESDNRKIPDQLIRSLRECVKDITFVFHQKSHDGVNKREISPLQQEEEQKEEEENNEEMEEEKLKKQKTPPEKLITKIEEKTGRKRRQEISNISYLAYCPQPTDWDNYNWCCTFPYMGSWKPSCCPFAIPTGAVITLLIASIILISGY
ncbi:hypothetical protein Mgra_00006654 [Meloidogyne graminicola]|uniref:DNA repair and recombination protein RAD54-like n=1 Tax=Meloidogyne graminicola TaxID=189291 RepID=A0A8S9ZKK0_9BILA|nr:hypothetical protein Mgra_00006654 [Meloidogyne graminicola]